jgi:hypothetical protein
MKEYMHHPVDKRSTNEHEHIILPVDYHVNIIVQFTKLSCDLWRIRNPFFEHD